MLVRYLHKTLELERMKQKKLDLSSATVRSNDEIKVRMLDNQVFRSMANLMYFFEFLNLHPELIDKFGDDVVDLLRLRVADPGIPKEKDLYD